MRYTFPNTYAEEKLQNEGPIRATASGFGGMQAVTEKGPVGVPVRHRTFEAWTKVFGGREIAARGDAAYEAKLFFDEGGFELITVRQVHFTDIADIASFVGGVSTRTALTEGVAETAATKITGSAPFKLEAGDTIDVDVDNVGAATITFDAASASVLDATTYPVADQNGNSFTYTDDEGPQIVTFNIATTTAQHVIDQANAQLQRASVVANGAQVEFITDKKGTDATIAMDVGTSGLSFAAPTAGTGDVANIESVTIAELTLIAENDSTIEVIDNLNNTATLSSPTTSSTSELDFTGGTALAAFGLSIEVIVGTDSGATFNSLKMEAGYHGLLSPGVNGNTLSTQIVNNPRKASVAAGSDLAADITATDTAIQIMSLTGLTANSVLMVWDGTNIEYKTVTGIRTEVNAGVVEFYVDVAIAFTNSFTAVASQVQSMEFDMYVYEGATLKETLQYNSMLDASDDYVVAKINDENLGSQFIVVTDLSAAPGVGADFPANESAKVALSGGSDETLGMTTTDWVGDQTARTGLYAWDTINEFMPFCTPGMNEAGVVHAAALYAQNRMWFEYISYIDIGMSKDSAIAFRNSVLGVDSSYVTLYAGGVKVYDVAGSGSNPRRSIIGLGLHMGLRSRVDSLPAPNGGPWQSPAGEGEYGVSRSALDIVDDYSDSDSGAMNDNGINVIRKFGTTQPVTVWGARTLDASPNGAFKYISTRRFFQYAEKSIVDSTRWGVFRNNDFRLWGKLKDRVDTWLTGLMPAGAFPTPVKELAFFVKVGIDDGVMDATDKDNGNVIGDIGMAPNKPGEFIIFRFSQFDSGYDVLETA